MRSIKNRSKGGRKSKGTTETPSVDLLDAVSTDGLQEECRVLGVG